jgi:hypothetical protein
MKTVRERIEALAQDLQSGIEQQFAETNDPDFDPDPFVFIALSEGFDSQVIPFPLMQIADEKDKAFGITKAAAKAVAEIDKDVLVAALWAGWTKDVKTMKRNGEVVLAVIESPKDECGMLMLRVTRHENAPPTVKREQLIIQEHPAFGEMSNFFGRDDQENHLPQEEALQ